MQVFHTAGVPPSIGSSIRPIIGWTRNRRVALRNKVSANSSSSGRAAAGAMPGTDALVGVALAGWGRDEEGRRVVLVSTEWSSGAMRDVLFFRARGASKGRPCWRRGLGNRVFMPIEHTVVIHERPLLVGFFLVLFGRGGP